MKQTINLLPVKVKQKGEWLSLLNMLLALALVLVLTLVVSVYVVVQKTRNSAQLEEMRVHNSQLQQQLAAQGAQLSQRKVPGLLQIKKDKLQRQIGAMQQLIEQPPHANAVGFSAGAHTLLTKLPHQVALDSYTLGEQTYLLNLVARSGKLTDLPQIVAVLERFKVLPRDRKMKIGSQLLEREYQFELKNTEGR